MTTEKAPKSLALLLSEALSNLAEAVHASGSDDRSIHETLGWPGPGLDRVDMSNYISSLAEKAKTLDGGAPYGAEQERTIKDLTERVGLLQKGTVPHLWDGNGAAASAAILLTLLTMDAALATMHTSWESAPNQYALPPKLAKRIRAAEVRVREVEETSGDIEAKIATITAAHDAADAFPADLETLEEGRRKLSQIAIDADVAKDKVSTANFAAGIILEALQEKEREAQVIIEKCHDTFRIATSTGLAWAFEIRAKNLSRSLWLWSASLLAALGAGVYLGKERVAALSALLAPGTGLEWGAIAMQLILSVATVGAPIWLAWLSTKQIGQRFRLAEDYAFKASVAMAYEGYRKEALALDNPDFAGRLFGVALERLEEAPLRLVTQDLHGSPIQEMLSSPAFLSAIEASSALREQLLRLVTAAGSRKHGPAPAPTSSSKPSAETYS